MILGGSCNCERGLCSIHFGRSGRKSDPDQPVLEVYECSEGLSLVVSTKDGNSGFRIAGPKMNGSNQLLRKWLLDDRACDEIIGYIKEWRRKRKKK